MDNLLFTSAQVRAIEAAAYAQLAPGTLMQRAGQAAFARVRQLLGSRPGPVLLLAGPGNNGGDALELAALLAASGYAATVVELPSPRPSAERTAARERALATGVRWQQAIDPGIDWALAVDGLFGIGLTRAFDAPARNLIEAINSLPCPVLALDVPSGLDADSGVVPDCAVQASETLTFLGNKPGLHTASGRDVAGQVTVHWLGIERAGLPAPAAELTSVALFSHSLRPRAHNSHKGSFGDVVVLGGDAGMLGAPMLAARSALYSGAGRIYLGALGPALAVDPLQPEIMWRGAHEIDLDQRTLVVGPGMGESERAGALLERALQSDSDLVLDADALNLLARDTRLAAMLGARRRATILTPHPLEAARLLGTSTGAIQAQRLQAANTLAQRFQATVILKGSGSVIAAPGMRACINPTGNPALASGGTGDVLAGLCGALLAQGWLAQDAARGAAYIHGQAADDLVRRGIGPIGLCAGELAPAMRTVLNGLASQARDHA